MMDALAREMAMSKMTLYRSFPSKTALVEAVILEKFRNGDADLSRMTSVRLVGIHPRQDRIFFLICLLDTILISLVGTLSFGMPLRGSIGALAVGAVLFILCMLGIGQFISTISMTQQQTMVSGFLFNMLSITFSGFGTLISSMSEWMQTLTYLNPLRYFLEVLRGVYCKDVELDMLWPPMAAMGLLVVVMLAIKVARFQKSLD